MTLKLLILNRFSFPEQSHVTLERAARSEYVLYDTHTYSILFLGREQRHVTERKRSRKHTYQGILRHMTASILARDALD